MKNRSIHRRKKVSMLVLVLMLLSACAKNEETPKGGILEQVEAYQGYQREITEEEYDFYTYFVKREVTGEITKQELADRVEAYANRVNAIFYLANKFDLCEPYSFEVLKFRMEQENEIRKVKKENGQMIYGLEQFTLEQFFQYHLGNVEVDIRNYLEEQTDSKILEEARKYLEENKADFCVRETVIYEVDIAGNKEHITADRTELNFMQDADPALADFLQEGTKGEKYQDIQSEGTREVIIKEVFETEAEFEKDKATVVAVYINKKLYPELVQKAAQNNPVSIRFKIEN